MLCSVAFRFHSVPSRSVPSRPVPFRVLVKALDSAVVEVQEMFSSHGGHLTNAMYHHGKHSKQINTP